MLSILYMSLLSFILFISFFLFISLVSSIYLSHRFNLSHRYHLFQWSHRFYLCNLCHRYHLFLICLSSVAHLSYERPSWTTLEAIWKPSKPLRRPKCHRLSTRRHPWASRPAPAPAPRSRQVLADDISARTACFAARLCQPLCCRRTWKR